MSAFKSSFFVDLPSTPPDPILSLGNDFSSDLRQNKINAGIGVVVNEQGQIWVPRAVKKVYESLELAPVSYLTAWGQCEHLGLQNFLWGTFKLFFGGQAFSAHAQALLDEGKVVAVGAPGGTGALAVLAQGLKMSGSKAKVYVGAPTWPNHYAIFRERDIEVNDIEHVLDGQFNLAGYIAAANSAPQGSYFILHGGLSHNPTGINPNEQELDELITHLSAHKVIIDMPYAGLVDGFETDSMMIRKMLAADIPMVVCISFSKNAGLYNQRPGVLLSIESSAESALKTQRLLNNCARIMYSTPPALGEKIVGQILSDDSLLADWQKELALMAKLLKKRRRVLAKNSPLLKDVVNQSGLFSMLPISPAQVKILREKNGIFMPANGRVNIGGLTLNKAQEFARAVNEL